MPKNPGPTALRPLPIRVTQLQFTRLQALRDYDDLAVQEHIRRALDDYLDKIETKIHGHAARTTPGRATGDLSAVRAAPLPAGKRKHALPDFVAKPPDHPGKGHQKGVAKPKTQPRPKVTFR